MRIIDAHIHFSNIESFKRTASEISHVDYSAEGLSEELKAVGVAAVIGMGVEERSPGAFPDFSASNPMGLDLDKPPAKVARCLGINPALLKGQDILSGLDGIEDFIKDENTVGIKIYAGYYPYYVYDDIYAPVYKLAEKYDLPVVLHSGDTFSDRGLLKYSHPLNVDELAVAYRNVRFIISHFGDPWVLDAAEVTMKNSNVYVDLSGLIVGDGDKVDRMKNNILFLDNFKKGLIYVDNFRKVLFGSDWPLVPIGPYIEFIKTIIPEEHYGDVFYNNALDVFPRLKLMGL